MEAEQNRTNLTDVPQIRGRLRLETADAFETVRKEPGFLCTRQEPDCGSLYYVEQGSVHFVSGGAEQLLQEGDMILFGPGQWHVDYADVDASPTLALVRFCAEGRDLSGLYGRCLPSPQAAAALLGQILQEQRRGDEYSGDMILALLSQLLLTLHRSFGEVPHTTGNNENEIILRAQKYVSSHIRERLTVPIVARMVNVSPSYLTALFDKHLRISPGEYIRRCKLQESKDMIRQGNMSFTQISEALQYSTVHHFSRQFKEKFGITPTQYARSAR